VVLDGRVILKRTLKEYDFSVWIEIKWAKVRTSGRLLNNMMNFQVLLDVGSFRPTERLTAFQEVLYSTQLIQYELTMFHVRSYI
jgi:hypothetical protein